MSLSGTISGSGTGLATSSTSDIDEIFVEICHKLEKTDKGGGNFKFQ